jgi:hypothetical protein
LDVSDDSLRFSVVRSRVYDDRGSRTCQRSRNAASNVAPGAGNNRNTPGKFLIAHFVAFRLVWHLIMSSKLRRPTGAKRARYFAASAARTASAGDWTSP